MAYHGGVNAFRSAAPQLAVHCQWLKRSVEARGGDGVATLCMHPAREGSDCVGPFLEDLSTHCGLWEAHPRKDLIPLPAPERWQRRRRREGYIEAPGGRDPVRDR